MKNTLIILLIVFVGCKDNISDPEKKRAKNFYLKANEYLIERNFEKAEEYLINALAIDEKNLTYHQSLIGLYSQNNKLDKAFELLEKLPKPEKEGVYYYQTQGGLFELKNNLKKAKER